MDVQLDDEHSAHQRLVRPYMVTRGRTQVLELAIETMVVARPVDVEVLADESRDLYGGCAKPVALAELSVTFDLPLGIVRVLVADMVRDGQLEAFETAAPSDAAIVRRILNAISH